MKKILLVVSIMMITEVSGQVRFGLKTGFHLTDLSKYDDRESRSAFHFHSGILLDWQAKQSPLGIQAAVLYKPMGYGKSNVIATAGDIVPVSGYIANHRINYIEVAVYLLYHWKMKEINLSIGPGTFLAFSPGDRMTLDGGEKFGNNAARPGGTSGINNTIGGLGLQAELEWSRLFFQLHYHKTISDIYDNNFSSTEPKWKLNSFGISMGFYFK